MIRTNTMRKSGRRATGAAAIALSLLLLAGALAGCTTFPYSNQTITAQVKAVDGQEVTLQPGELAEPEAAGGVAPTTVDFQRLDDAIFQVGNTSVYTVDAATRAAATVDPALFDASFTISFDGEAIAYDSLYVTNEVRDGVTVLTISAGGSYTLAGTLPAGQVVIDTPDPVRLVLNAADIANDKGSVITRTQPGTLVIAPAPNTDNKLKTTAPGDGEHGVAAIAGAGPVIVTSDGSGAGAGTLYIESTQGDGIEALSSATVASKAAANSATDPGNTTANGATDSGNTATNGATEPGVISVGDVTLGVNAAHNALCAENYLTITGGTIDITAGEDGLASTGDVHVGGGDLAIDAGDDAVHGEFALVVEGGTLASATCKEGLEAERIYMREGTVAITSSDDGVNASAPEAYDSETPDGYEEIQSCVIAIGGGTLRVDASGDGLDTNGSLQINGGTTLVSAPESGDNTALDYDGAAVLVGGYALLTGTNGMTHGFTVADQGYVDAVVDGAAGQTLTLADANGAVLITWAPPRAYTFATVTARGVTAGQTYHLVVDGAIEPAPAAGADTGALADFAKSGTVTGGTVVPVEAIAEASTVDGGAPMPGIEPREGATAASDVAQQRSADGATNEPPARQDGTTNEPPARPDGSTNEPPARPDGAGSEPPARPEGETADSATPPEPPEGTTDTPPELPEGVPAGGNGGAAGFAASDAPEFTITVSADQASTLKEGDVVEVTFGAGDAVESITPIGGGAGMPGAPGATTAAATGDNGTAATTIDTDEELTGETFSSTAADENALRVTDGANATLRRITIDKSAGDTTNEDASNFYGMNAGLLVTDAATATINGAKVTTNAAGANGVFAQGTDAKVTIDNAQITTTADNSGGLMGAGGATVEAREVSVDTAGKSAAAIRSDRGGATMNIQGGSFTTSGTGSPAIYSTAAIAVADATLDAAASEAVVVEGANSVSLTNCEVSGAMTGTYGAGSGENIHGVMLYQSMSGDAAAGESSFKMDGGFLGTATGDLFYVTNTSCAIEVSGVELGLGDGVLLRVAGNDGRRGWGRAGSNGGTCAFTARNETVNGDIVVDSISKLAATLVDTNYTGAINPDEAAGQVDITLEGASAWTLTADSHVSSFTGDLSQVNAAGHHLYVNGDQVL